MTKKPSFQIDLISEGRIMVVTLDRPPVNALAMETYKEISEIVSTVSENEEICALIFRSEGKVFCAGADIKELATYTPQDEARMRLALRKASNAFYNCPVPVITAVQGGAIGGGALFAACGDIILSTEEAFFALTEIDVGLIGGAKGLSRFLPQQKIRMMALTGKRVPANDVYRLGGVEEIVSKEELFDTAKEYAKTIADKGSMAARMWKEALAVTEEVNPREGFLIEQCLSQELSLVQKEK